MNGLVQFHHAVLSCRTADKPAIQWIIEHRLVCTPTVWVVVHMLLYLKCDTLLLHLHAEHHIQVFGLVGCLLIVLTINIELRSISILHVVTCMTAITSHVHTSLHEVIVQLFHHIVLTLQVHHRTSFTFLINKEERRYFSIFGHLGIISTKGRGNVYDTRTIVCSYIVARNHAEGTFLHFHEAVLAILTRENFLRINFGIFLHKVRCIAIQLLRWFHPRHQLLVLHSHQFWSHVFAHDAVRYHLVTMLVAFQWHILTLWLQVCPNQCLCHHHSNRLVIVDIVSLYGYILDLWSHAESHVGRQCPRSCGPCHEVRLTPLGPLLFWIQGLEERSYRSILHIAVAAWLIQFMARKTCSCTWRIRLNGVAFIEQTLVVKLTEQPPQGFDVLIIVSDIRVVQIHKVTHTLCQVTPLGSELHHVFTTTLVIILHRDVFLALLVVDILLCDAQFLLHAQLHRQSVCIPSCLALHLEA